MARVSIDSGSSSSKAGSGSAKKSSGKSGGGDAKSQKVKAIGAVAVLALAAVIIMWNAGLFESRPHFDASAPPEATPEQTAAFNKAEQQQQKQQGQHPPSTGGTRLPPMPLGSN